MPGYDDEDILLGELLGDTDLELEARFRELEQRADLDEVEARILAAERERRARSQAPPQQPGAADPLKDLKAAFEKKPEAAATEYLLVLCPSAACGRKNRLARNKALTAAPRCGACGSPLVFTR